jgi:hypothetical protein
MKEMLMVNISAIYTGTYLNAAELPLNKRQTLVIHGATLEVIGQDDGKNQKVVLSLVTPKGIACTKDVVLNKSNAITLASAYGDDTDNWIGKPIEIWAENVFFRGQMVPGIKIRPAPGGDGAQMPVPVPSADVEDYVPW